MLLLHGANLLDVNNDGFSALDRAKQIAEGKRDEEEEEEDSDDEKDGLEREERAKAIVEEMQSYLENPIRYRSDRSALIALSIGLASLDLPVLIVTIISEYLVSINQEKFFGQYPEHKNWKIATLIKKKAKIEN